MPYISLTDETIRLNSSLFLQYFPRMECKLCENLVSYFYQGDFPETGSRKSCTGQRWCGNSTPRWNLLYSVGGPGARNGEAWSNLYHDLLERFSLQGWHLKTAIYTTPMSLESFHQQVDMISDSGPVRVDWLLNKKDVFTLYMSYSG